MTTFRHPAHHTLTRRAVLRRGARWAAGLGAMTALGSSLAACSPGPEDELGQSHGSYATTISLVGFGVVKAGYDKVIPSFHASKVGSDIGVSTSFGASGVQKRKLQRHLPVDVANLSMSPEIDDLIDAGVVAEDWARRFPHNSVAFGSVVALVTRPGNPLNITSFDDLVRPGVEVLSPNPSSSGSSRWNLLGIYAALSQGGRDPQAGLDLIDEMVNNHSRVFPKSGREASSAFLAGQGDVLVTYENEAFFLTHRGEDIDVVVPRDNFRIDNPVTTVRTGEHPAEGKAFVDFLFSPEGQHAWADAGFRPVDREVAAATADRFAPVDTLWTTDDLGGWSEINKQLFAPGSTGAPTGSITTIYGKVRS